MSASKPILGYWNLRGLAEPIRYLLHYKEVDFEDKRYETATPETWREEDKFKLDLDFPNLPYYIDGDVRLSQSTAILRYLARKYDLIGETDEDQTRIELAEQQIIDLRTIFSRLCYNPEFEAMKDEFIKNIPTQLDLLTAFLGDRNFLAGDNITYVDFMLYEVFNFYLYLAPNALDGYENLKNFKERVGDLPTVKRYVKSPAFKRWPLLGPAAIFGGKGEEPKI